MVLTVDIGNSNVVIGGFSGGKEPDFIHRLPSSREWTEQMWDDALKALLMDHGSAGKAEGSILSSVVPEVTRLLCPVLKRLTGRPVITVDADFDDGLVLLHYDRKTLGNDRVVDAVSALTQFTPPLVVFDLGTATTMSVLDAEGRFLGGMILPGMRLSADALTSHTSQLPPITFEKPDSLLGTDAVSCMQRGIIYGTAAQIDGLCARVEELLGQPVTTVVTGGLSPLVIPHCRREICYEPHLLLKGLKLLYDRAQQKN